MTTTDTNARIHAHEAAGTLGHWRVVPYLPMAVTLIAEVDVSGRGRFRTIVVTEVTYEQAARELANICDGLPGGHRAYRAREAAA